MELRMPRVYKVYSASIVRNYIIKPLKNGRKKPTTTCSQSYRCNEEGSKHPSPPGQREGWCGFGLCAAHYGSLCAIIKYKIDWYFCVLTREQILMAVCGASHYCWHELTSFSYYSNTDWEESSSSVRSLSNWAPASQQVYQRTNAIQESWKWVP